MAYKQHRKKKKSKGKKLFRRLFVLGILGLILWTVFIGMRGAVGLTLALLNRPDYISTSTAVEVQDQRGLQGEAVLLREEIVVLADKPGVANLLSEDGEAVIIGDKVLEIVDKSLLASIEEELRKLDKQASQPSVDHSAEVAQIDKKIAEQETELQGFVSQYRTALAGRAIEQYKAIFANMNRSAKELSALQQDRLQLMGTVNAIQQQREALLVRREQAIVPVPAPAAGKVYYSVDGLEQKASHSGLHAGTFEALKAASGAGMVTRGGAKVSAGQPVFKLVTSSEVYLLVQLGKDNVNSTTAWQGVTVQSDALNDKAPFPASIMTYTGLGPDQLLLRTSDLIPRIHQERIVSVALFPQGEVLCTIPASAVLADNASVLVLEGTIARRLSVTVRERSGKSAIVSGLQPGVAVIRQPEGIADGEDVGPRLRK